MDKGKNTIQFISNLFPHLEENLTDVMTEKQKKLIMILEVIEIERYVPAAEYQWLGRRLKDRQAIARAFVAKALYNYATMGDLIEGLKGVKNLRRICGFGNMNCVVIRECG